MKNILRAAACALIAFVAAGCSMLGNDYGEAFGIADKYLVKMDRDSNDNLLKQVLDVLASIDEEATPDGKMIVACDGSAVTIRFAEDAEPAEATSLFEAAQKHYAGQNQYKVRRLAGNVVEVSLKR